MKRRLEFYNSAVLAEFIRLRCWSEFPHELEGIEERSRERGLVLAGQAPVKRSEMAKKPAVQPQKPTKKDTRCFRCDATGLICNICGESEAACSCEKDGLEPTYNECEDCGGTGK